MTSDCIYRDTLLKDIEESVVFSGQTPNAEIVGAKWDNSRQRVFGACERPRANR